MAVGFSVNVRIGIWLDDLKLGIKQGVKTIAPLSVEVLGINAFSADVSPKTLSPSGRRDLAHFVRSKARRWRPCARMWAGGDSRIRPRWT